MKSAKVQNCLTHYWHGGIRNSQLDHILVIDGGVFQKVSVDNAVFVLDKAATGTRVFRVIRAKASEPVLTVTGTDTIRADEVLASVVTRNCGDL